MAYRAVYSASEDLRRENGMKKSLFEAKVLQKYKRLLDTELVNHSAAVNKSALRVYKI